MSDYKIVELTCGLGNQMFQYAFAKSLQKHLGVQVLLDKTWFESEHCPVKFALDIFNIDLEYASKSQIQEVKKRTTRLPGFLRKLLKKQKYGFVTSSAAYEFCEAYLKPNNFRYFRGFFQNPQYFQSLSSEIRSIFAPPPLLLDTFDDFAKDALAKILDSKNSVFIHIRRGDYCNLSWNLGVDYYQKAIAYLQERIENPTFFVFSDDSDFVKGLDLGIDFEDLTRSIPLAGGGDMFLMSFCKHGIVANSTYSWWGAWLLDREDKIVLAPTPWLLDDDAIICQNWVKIARSSLCNTL